MLRNAMCCELIHSVVCRFGEGRLKVTGSSMLPVIWPGDEVVVARVKLTELEPGAIVLYRRNGGLTAHRIKRIQSKHLITWGDSLEYPDEPIPSDQIVGRVVEILRNGFKVRSVPSSLSCILSFFLRRSNTLRRLMLYMIRHLTSIKAGIYSTRRHVVHGSTGSSHDF